MVDTTATRRPRKSNNGSGVAASLAHHDTAITVLGEKVVHIEASMRGLQAEVRDGIHALSSTVGQLANRLETLHARPAFDLQRTLQVVVTMAALFSMTCGGIIWITTAQFSGTVAEQRGLNTAVDERLKRHELMLEKLLVQKGIP